MHCINEYFIEGCHFDEAFRNPCKEVEPAKTSSAQTPAMKSNPQGVLARIVDQREPGEEFGVALGDISAKARQNFSQEQQMKLRAIATGNRLIDTVIGKDGLIGRAPLDAISSFNDETNAKPFEKSSETLIIYLLVTMIVVTLIATIVIVVVAVTCTRPKATDSELQTRSEKSADATVDSKMVTANALRQSLSERNHSSRKHRHDRTRISTYSSRTNSPPTRVVITKGYSPNTVISKYDITDSSAL